ncbi:MAG: hypothetical protein U5J63_12115 [Fodinibius sp.]|nr:hypothetical protein [Fodinibius sp.]
MSDSTASINIENPMNATPQQLQIMGVEVEGLTTSREQFVIGTSGLQRCTKLLYPVKTSGRQSKISIEQASFPISKLFKRVGTRWHLSGNYRFEEQPRLQEYTIEGVKN